MTTAPRSALVAGRWPSPDATDTVEIVVRQKYAMGQKVGSWRRLESDTGIHAPAWWESSILVKRLRSHFPKQRLMARQIVGRRRETRGRKRAPSDARIVLHRAEDRAAFTADWQEKLASRPGRMELWDGAAVRQANNDTPAAESARTAVLTAVLLAGACVVCRLPSACKGVPSASEQHNSRSCVPSAASRGTLATVVLAEAFVLAIVGLLCAVALTWGVLERVGCGGSIPEDARRAGCDERVAITGGVILAGVLAGSAWPAFSLPRAHARQKLPLTSPTPLSRRPGFGEVGGAVIAVAVAIVIAGTIFTTAYRFSGTRESPRGSEFQRLSLVAVNF